MRAITTWICCCAYLVCAGWILSLLGQLNPAGYAVVVVLGLAGLGLWRKKNCGNFLPNIYWPKYCRRFRKPFPAIFLLIALLALLGGAIYAPNNYDALTYRLPRMLNWLVANHWFWIQTANQRMNYSTPAWEWVAMPLFALFHSDRVLFLINIIGFLLLPGLLFSLFRRLGVARKVAWTWMWIFPLAYGYAMQAGGIENDLTGAVFGLSAMFFALRARQTKRVEDLWLTALAAALLTNAKLSDLPLLLPCLVAVWPALCRLRERLLAGFTVAVIALAISAVPTIILNQLNTGSWTGDPSDTSQIRAKSPAAALLGNSLLLAQQSFMPPVLPGARKINNLLDKKMPASWQQTLKDKFPRYYLTRLNELPQEETSGLGIGVTTLLLVSAGAAALGFRPGNYRRKIPAHLWIIGLAGWLAVLAYMLKMGSEATARLMLPYYPLAIIPLLWLPLHERLVQCRYWKFFAAVAALCVLPGMIISPSRPLFPAQTIIGRLASHHPHSAGIQRFATVYSTYANRNDVLAPLRAAIPADVTKIGFVAGSNDTDYSLWRPFGQRQVVELTSDRGQSVNVPDDFKWIVIKNDAWADFSNVPLQEWAAQHHAQIVVSVPLVVLVSWGPQTWCLLHIENPVE
jgi:hypothetical protein